MKISRTMATKQYSTVELAEISKWLFKEHGRDLMTVITSLHLELCDRCATLEERLKDLEAKCLR
jgi:hypothetical protein